MKGGEELEPKMRVFVHTVSLRSVGPGMCLREKKNISVVHKTLYVQQKWRLTRLVTSYIETAFYNKLLKEI